jgi:hypothetical protein
LGAELSDRTEEIRGRDHISAGLVERVRELPAGVPDTQDAVVAPRSDDAAARASETYTPISDTLALTWRRWWRRVTGSG